MVPDVIADPETDPTATFALDPGRVRTLLRDLVASGPTTTTHTPMTGAPLATFHTSTAADVALVCRYYARRGAALLAP